MKKIFLALLLLCSSVFAQTSYNAIATAYVTTTISQQVVFNSAMQQGGTFTFSVLAHNGGGRAGEHDTANVKIQFYTSGGSLVTSVNSNYNRNLLNPNAVCGNPCIDTSVPWSTLTTSTTLSAAQAATVAYATVSMYGVDGSFWAGDYGPWYRAPTLQHNSSGNLLYNPEFGPYNNQTAQGWTASPGFGACQGAWGGSNACIVNSDGVPGSSTAGLVANANGGGPSATGGTTSGTAGGYNSTMSVTNAGTGATAGSPPAPTVTSTTTTYSTRSTTSGTTTYNYRTPTTVTNYSDGTSTSAAGSESLYTTAVTSTQTISKIFSNRTLTYNIPMVTTTVASTNASTTAPVTPAVVPPGYISIVPYTSTGGWEIKNYTYTATNTGTGYLMFAFRNDANYWVMDNVSIKANNTGPNLLVNGGLDKVGLMTANVGGVNQTVAAPTAWGLAYQTNQSPTLGGGYDSGMWYDTSTGSYGAIYQNVNFTAGTTYTISFMVASDYNANGDTVQMAVYAGSCDGSSTQCTLPASTGMTSAVKPSQTYTVGCTNDCPPAPPVPPNWQTIRTTSSPVVISNIYPTSNNSPAGEGAANAFDGNPSTKYLNFDKANAGVTVKLSQGRVVKKFTITTANDFPGRDPTSYKLYGSNDGVNWTLIKADTVTLSDSRYTVSDEIDVNNTNPYIYYFILFPTTKAGQGCGQNCNSMQIGDITYYYDLDDGITSTDTGGGGTPNNPGTAGSVCADCAPTWPETSEITVDQLAQKNAAKARVASIQLGNYVYIDQKIGSSGNNVTIEQTGNYNKISGLGGTDYAIINGDNNIIDIKQGDTIGKNLIEFSITGNTNNVSIWQARNPTTGLQDGNESGGHYIGLNVTGSSNTLGLKQSNDGGTTSGHFAYIDITGNNNNGTLKQSGNGEKTFFGIVNGNANVFDISQQGTGSFFDLSLTGNGHNVTANQKDAGSHKATVNLTNAGGSSTVNLVQQGAAAQNINITQQCATLSGCSVSVTQGQ
jgi:hypothetical protein